MHQWSKTMFTVSLAVFFTMLNSCTGHVMPECRRTGCKGGSCQVAYDGKPYCMCHQGYVVSQTDSTTCLPLCPYKPCTDGDCYYTMAFRMVCVCRDGYILSAADPTVCVPRTPVTDPCSQMVCENGLYSGPKCHRKPGYRLSPTNATKCELMPKPACTLFCSKGTCARSYDGFMYCLCPTGYRRNIYNPALCDPVNTSPFGTFFNQRDPPNSFLSNYLMFGET